MAWISLDNLTRFYIKLKEKMYLKTEIDSQLANKSDILHNHDDRYYTKSEIDDNLYGAPITNVTVNGTAEVGKTLTATVVPSSVQDLCSYQWYRASANNESGTAISGATSSTYTLTSSDKTYYIYCVVSIGNANRQSNYTSAIKEITVTDVRISGTAEVGQTLTATASPSSIQNLCSYQWYRAAANGGGGTAISGATGKTYTLVDTDRTNYIYCIATLNSASAKSNYTSVIKGWISWSITVRSPSDGGWSQYFPNEQSISYTIPSTVKATYVECTSWVRDHTGGDSPGHTVASLYAGGQWSTGGRGQVYDGAHVEASSSCSYSNSVGISNQTVYGYDNRGDSNGGGLKRKIQLYLSGLQLA